jgi:hypothetical protein
LLSAPQPGAPRGLIQHSLADFRAEEWAELYHTRRREATISSSHAASTASNTGTPAGAGRSSGKRSPSP